MFAFNNISHPGRFLVIAFYYSVWDKIWKIFYRHLFNIYNFLLTLAPRNKNSQSVLETALRIWFTLAFL